jgi:two-component system response regulator DesR
MVIRVLLVEETDLVRGALAALLAREEDIEVVAESAGSAQAVARAMTYRPDVVVIDIDGAEDRALAAARELASRLPECHTVLVAGAASPDGLRKALALRVPGMVGKNGPSGALADGIRTVADGGRFIDPELALLAIDAAENPLTPREREVLRLAADGTPTRDIAGQLSLSVGTVRNHLNAVSHKIGARNRIDAIRIARESGWL